MFRFYYPSWVRCVILPLAWTDINRAHKTEEKPLRELKKYGSMRRHGFFVSKNRKKDHKHALKSFFDDAFHTPGNINEPKCRTLVFPISLPITAWTTCKGVWQLRTFTFLELKEESQYDPFYLVNLTPRTTRSRILSAEWRLSQRSITTRRWPSSKMFNPHRSL